MTDDNRHLGEIVYGLCQYSTDLRLPSVPSKCTLSSASRIVKIRRKPQSSHLRETLQSTNNANTVYTSLAACPSRKFPAHKRAYQFIWPLFSDPTSISQTSIYGPKAVRSTIHTGSLNSSRDFCSGSLFFRTHTCRQPYKTMDGTVAGRAKLPTPPLGLLFFGLIRKLCSSAEHTGIIHHRGFHHPASSLFTISPCLRKNKTFLE